MYIFDYKCVYFDYLKTFCSSTTKSIFEIMPLINRSPIVLDSHSGNVHFSICSSLKNVEGCDQSALVCILNHDDPKLSIVNGGQQFYMNEGDIKCNRCMVY